MLSEKAWTRHINSLKIKGKTTKTELKKKLVNAVVERLPKKKFGIMFSGGIDSSLIALIAKQNKAKFICYSVGLEGAADLEASKKAAKLLKIKLKTKTYSLEHAAADAVQRAIQAYILSEQFPGLSVSDIRDSPLGTREIGDLIAEGI